MLHSLRPRLLLALFLVVLVAVGTVALLGSRATSNEFQRYVDNQSVKRGRSMAELMIYYRQNRSWENVQPLLEQMALISGDRILLTDAEGRIIADSERELLGEAISTLELQKYGRTIPDVELEPAASLSSAELGRPAALITSEGAASVYVYIISPSDEEPSTGALFLSEVNRRLIFAVISAGAVGLLLTLFLSRRILHPVEALTAAARVMEKGDLSQRVQVQSRDEIGVLAQAFNAMADGLAQQEHLRRNMASDIAHELRTPLSNIRGYLEAIRDGVVVPTPELVESLHEEAMHLSHLVDDLQDMALAEAGALELHREPMAMDAIIEAAVHALQPRAWEKNLRVIVEIAPDLPLAEVDHERMGQVLRNLLANAIAYTQPGGEIHVSAWQEGGCIMVQVQDTGIGIASEHLPYIFERFYRVDSSRARATGGTGLGLAITKQWVEAHGGRIEVQSEQNHGTSISFSVPLTRPAPA